MRRRAFLRGLGGALIALPFFESIEMRGVRADTPTFSKRFLVFFQCNGVNMSQFFPTSSFGALTASSFGATSALAPLAPYASKLLIPRGLHMEPKGYGQGGPGCDHQTGMSHKLTAQQLNAAGGYPNGISVDQEAAKSLNPPGVSALTAAVGYQSPDLLGTISYSGSQTPVKGQNNPKLLLQSLTFPTGDTKAQDMLNARHQSVLDLVTQDMTNLKKKLNPPDQQKLDMHLTNLRAVEVAVSAISLAPTPDLLARVGAVNSGTVTDDANYKTMGQLTMEIIALAVAANRNNVASILWGRGSQGPAWNWEDPTFTNTTQTQHKISHGGSELVPNFMSDLFKIDTWHANQFKFLLDKLNAYTEGTGTVLDNSAVMWINELSDGDYHQFHDLPIVIAGSAGGALKTGQYLNMTKTAPSGSTDSNGNFKGNMILGDESAAHNMLLTTLLNAVGAKTGGQPYTRFGDAGLPSGQYSQLLV